jgi:hypothetical protein
MNLLDYFRSPLSPKVGLRITGTLLGGTVKQFEYRKKEILEKLYVQRCMSTNKIAEIFGVDGFTISRWLRRHGIPRRGRAEYGIVKYPKRAFFGDLIEKSYLIGLRYGDIYACREGKQIRVSTTSTHPAFLTLFKRTFSNYTHVIHMYPQNDGRGSFGWCISCLLHPSFDFLLKKDSTIPSWILQNQQCFLSFLAGFFDSEGSILICRADPNYIGYRLRLPSVNVEVLKEIKGQLSRYGFCPKLYRAYRSGRCRKVEINRKSDVFKLLSLLPIKHPEKIMRRQLAFRLKAKKFWEEVKPDLLTLGYRIKEEVRQCIRRAEMMWNAKRGLHTRDGT